MAYNPANPFQDKSNSGDPYDYVRQKATQDAGNAKAQGLDAITRRYSAMGNLNSGAYVKSIEDADRSANQQAQDTIGQSYMAEQAQTLPYAQMAQQKEQFEKGLGEQKSEFDQNLAQKGHQFEAQMEMDKKTNDLNAGFAQFQMSHSGGLFGGGGFLGLGL